MFYDLVQQSPVYLLSWMIRNDRCPTVQMSEEHMTSFLSFHFKTQMFQYLGELIGIDQR